VLAIGKKLITVAAATLDSGILLIIGKYFDFFAPLNNIS